VIVSEANGGGLVLNTDEQQNYKSNNLGEDDAAEAPARSLFTDGEDEYMYNMDNLIRLVEEMIGDQINSVFENTFSGVGKAPRGSGARRGAAGAFGRGRRAQKPDNISIEEWNKMDREQQRLAKNISTEVSRKRGRPKIEDQAKKQALKYAQPLSYFFTGNTNSTNPSKGLTNSSLASSVLTISNKSQDLFQHTSLPIGGGRTAGGTDRSTNSHIKSRRLLPNHEDDFEENDQGGACRYPLPMKSWFMAIKNQFDAGDKSVIEFLSPEAGCAAINSPESFYIRGSLIMWDPQKSCDATICCPECGQSKNVKRVSWHSLGPRRVFDIGGCPKWLWGRIHQCNNCNHRFLSYNRKALHLMRDQFGEPVPWISERLGVVNESYFT